MAVANSLSPRSRRRAAMTLASPTPGHYLAVDDGDSVVLIALRPGMTRIGRGTTADVGFDDNSVSSRHAVLMSAVDGGVELLDDGSLNGTWVNGDRVRRHRLVHGDVVGVGHQTLRFVEARAAAPRHATEELEPVSRVALAA